MQETVFKLGMSRNSNNQVTISVLDAHSGDLVLKAVMELDQTALFLTGLHGVTAAGQFNEEAVITKKRETKKVTCERVSMMDGGKQVQKDKVLSDFNNVWFDPTVPYEDAWRIQSDGTSSQQRGDKHEYIIKRYVPVEDPTVCERGY